jgi:predicted metalloprotease with PDZ domain
VAGPHVAWYQAGLRTGDEVVAVNGRAVDGPAAWRAALAGTRIGDRVTVDVRRDGRPIRAVVTLPGYQRLRVRLVDVPTPGNRQRMVRTLWLRGPAPIGGA